MNPIIRNTSAVLAGWLGGSVINNALIYIGHKLIPIQGIDPNDMKALGEVIPTLESKYFIFPFLAHAFGTLAGAIIAGLIAASYKMKFSLSIGILFLLGGIMISYMLPAPTWFLATDILLAYIPMAWLGGTIVRKIQQENE